jgi:m7GpppX diphosphatase
MNKSSKIYYRTQQELISETYEEYLETRKNMNHEHDHDRWIIDIFDGKKEKEKIIYNDNKIILLSNVSFDEKDLSQLDLLAFVKDIELKTIRDLTQKDILLLEYLYETCIKVIENKYGIKKSKIRAYFHYHPTTWILHVHFNLISNNIINASVEYSYPIWNVIENLKLDSNYYRKIIMTVCRK